MTRKLNDATIDALGAFVRESAKAFDAIPNPTSAAETVNSELLALYRDLVIAAMAEHHNHSAWDMFVIECDDLYGDDWTRVDDTPLGMTEHRRDFDWFAVVECGEIDPE